jgi:hypothetical protein
MPGPAISGLSNVLAVHCTRAALIANSAIMTATGTTGVTVQPPVLPLMCQTLRRPRLDPAYYQRRGQFQIQVVVAANVRTALLQLRPWAAISGLWHVPRGSAFLSASLGLPTAIQTEVVRYGAGAGILRVM